MKKRVLSVLLALSLFVPMLPIGALATAARAMGDDTVAVCSHHKVHDAECGYVEAVEGRPCEFVCEACSHIVLDWAWETNHYLAPGEDYGIDDTAWVLGLPALEEDDLNAVLPERLPDAIIASMKDGSVLPLSLTWDLENPQTYTDAASEEGGAENRLYTASLPEGYTIDENTPEVTALVQMAEETPLAAVAPLADEPGTEVVPPSKETPANTKGDLEARDDALHFYIRHWHTTEPDQTQLNAPMKDEASGNYFMFVDGYIVPTGEDGENKYDLYLIDHRTPADAESDRPAVQIDRDDDEVSDSNYVKSFDSKDGTVVLKALPLGGEESFAGFTVSAGQTAVDMVGDGDAENIDITYDAAVHLVKGHVFYISEADAKIGSHNEEVLGTDILENPELDTVWVYKYTETGEIVTDGSGAAVKQGEESKLSGIDGVTYDAETGAVTGAELVKIYSTTEGLHTDKTATVNPDWTVEDENGVEVPDGRTFDLELEAWNTMGHAPYVGMVLDASGSMAFTASVPTLINVSDQNSKYYSAYDKLKDKIGYANKNNSFAAQTDDDFITSLSGYYEFQQNSAGSGANAQRNWYLNSVRHAPSSAYGEMNNGMFAKAAERVALNSGTIDFSKTTGGVITPSDYNANGLFKGKTFDGWGDTAAPAKFAASCGFSLSSSAANSAFVPEVQPEGNSFTLSFTLRQDAATPESFTGENKMEILYVGPEETTVNNDDYLRVYRQGGNVYAYIGQKQLFAFSTGFTNGTKARLTLVFDNGTITAYLNGAYQGSGSASLGGSTVVFGPFTGYQTSTNDVFSVDSIFLFKDKALNQSQVTALMGLAVDAGISDVQKVTTVKTEAFLTDAELALLLDKHNTDNSALGVAGYSYFIYNPNSGTEEYGSLGYCSGANSGAVQEYNLNGDGWYYTSFRSAFQGDLKTYKAAYGLANSVSFTDTIETGTTTAGEGKGAAPNFKGEPANTDVSYTTTGAGPAKFYIDEDGYLRCFFASGNMGKGFTSYVYELSDEEYVKKESLQRAMGAFITRLLERSSTSKVSAVRFSDTKITGEDLLLLDWTNDPVTAQKAMSLQWGDGMASGQGTDSGDGNTQYDYILTGGTYTNRGIDAYINVLDDAFTKSGSSVYLGARNSAAYKNTDKYLIIFTDGAPSGSEDAAKTAADKLKGYGYTIFTVLLTGGSVEYSDDSNSTYQTAKKFLLDLSGKSSYDPGDSRENYFYATAYEEMKTRLPEGVQDGDWDKTDMLVYAFVQDIMEQITIDLTEYTMQDYIDPRFNLVDSGNNIWQLNAKGKVTVGGTTYALGKGGANAANGVEFRITDEENTSTNKPNPYLYYDDGKDMYYLKWMGQTIPTCVVGEEKLTVWSAKFTVQAKDDFIGGNAVLTNGNAAYMNFVYPDGTLTVNDDGTATSTSSSGSVVTVSSGTALAAEKANRSKGFPRVSVNVTPPEEDIVLDQTIFMGEYLDRNLIAEMIIEKAEEDASNDAQNYWEYLRRFVNYFNALKETEEGREIIETLHQMNRSGEYIPTDRPDQLDPGYMKIISNRIYDLIYGYTSADNPNGDTLTLNSLSELLMRDSNIDEGGVPGQARKERYLYIPYIYLPDDLDDPSNSTGNGMYRYDVIGYLFFHIDEQHTDGTYIYPAYPEDGITKTTDTYMSQLTVSFVVRSAADRALWNNSQSIQETKNGTAPGLQPVYNGEYGWPNAGSYPAREDVEAQRVYKRDPDHKSAAGTETDTEKDPIVVKGTFTTKVVSGEIQLQMKFSSRITDDMIRELKENSSITYTADLYRTYEKKVQNTPAGEIARMVRYVIMTVTGLDDAEENGGAASARPGYAYVTEKVGQLIYKGEVKDYTDESAEEARVFVESVDYVPVPEYEYTSYETGYGLPLGTYTLVPVSFTAPQRFGFSGVRTVENTDPAYNWTTEGEDQSRVFVVGTGYESEDGSEWENNYIAEILGTTQIRLGYDGNDEPVYRLGLDRLQIDTVGDLEINKTVVGDEHKGDEFTFTVQLEVPDNRATEGLSLSSVYYAMLSDSDNDAGDDTGDGDIGDNDTGDDDTGMVYVYVDDKGFVYMDKGHTEKLTLKDGQSITIYSISSDVKCTVTEELTEDQQDLYVTTVETVQPNGDGTAEPTKATAESSSASVNIVWNKTAEVNFTNKAVHTLTIEKHVAGELGDKAREWQFDIELPDGTYSATYKGDGVSVDEVSVVVKDGKAKINDEVIKLKDSESLSIVLPCETEYTVTETDANLYDDTNYTYYGTTINGIYSSDGKKTGELTDDVTLSYTNTNPFTLVEVKKTVESAIGDDKTTEEFEFTVTVVMPDGRVPKADSYRVTTGGESGYLELTLKEGKTYTGTISLKHGETAVIHGLPEGTKVTVEEAEDMRFTTKVDGKDGRTSDEKTVKEKEENKISFGYTNTRSAFALEVTKTVTGNLGNREEKFNFTATFTDGAGSPLTTVQIENADGSYREERLTNGKYTFELGNGDTMNFPMLPKDTKYVIEEDNSAPANAYTTTVSVNGGNPTSGKRINGEIDGSRDVTVSYVNERTGAIPTDATGELWWLIPFLLAGTAGFAWIISRYQGGKHSRRGRRRRRT